MDLLEHNGAFINLRITPDEAVAINNALNESLEAFDDGEFETRMGVTRADVVALLDAFSLLWQDGRDRIP